MYVLLALGQPGLLLCARYVPRSVLRNLGLLVSYQYTLAMIGDQASAWLPVPLCAAVRAWVCYTQERVFS